MMSSGTAREKGAALVFGLITATVLSVAGVGASRSSVVQSRMANNYRFSIEAMNGAEAGLRTAIAAFNTATLSLDGFNDQLDPNGDGLLGDRYTLALADYDRNLRYRVVLVDDDDGDGNLALDANGIVRMVAQGASSQGSTRTVAVRISDAGLLTPPVILNKAILSEDSITFSGNSEYNCSNGDIHSNENLEQTNKPRTAGVLSAHGSIPDGAPLGGGTIAEGVPTVDIPDILPSAFESYVDFVFESDGSVYDEYGSEVASLSDTEDGWNGWKFTEGDFWETVGETVLGGDLYFKGADGNVKVASNPGEVGSPWVVSILADGFIQLSGNPVIDNYLGPGDPPAVQTILFMSGTDIMINGNLTQTGQGLIAAAEQFSVSGVPNIQGSIISGGQDNSATNDSDMVLFNEISGDMQLCYNGGLSMPGGGGATGVVEILSWQELEIARGTGVFAAI